MTSRRRDSSEARRERRSEVDDPAVVMEAAAVFLAVRPRSVAETRRRLRHLGYRERLVDDVIERLVQMAYLDDQAFARGWVESRDRARPRGAAALRRELELKGVAANVISEALGEREQSSTANADLGAARRLLERRRAALERESDPRKQRQKAYALLARNGFDPEVCREVSAALDGASATDE